MDNKYICAIFKNKISGLIHTIHLIDLNNKIVYNGSTTIGKSSFSYVSNTTYSYDYFFNINQNQFLEILNTSYKDIYGKTINFFSIKFNIGIENFI